MRGTNQESSASNSFDNSAIRIGAWLANPARDEISKDELTVKLEPRLMRLLICLAEHAGQVVSIDNLLDEVWKNTIVTQASVYQAIATLRRSLGNDSETPAYIASVARRGYRLLAPVSRVLDASQRSNIGSKETARAVAVLPFADMSEDQGQRYFTDGLSVELINLLMRIPGLCVPASTSSFYFRNKSEDIASIARRLMVTHVLEGSVRKSGNDLRITVQLVHAESGYLVWSQRYDRQLDDVFRVQDEIAVAVTSALKVSILGVPSPTAENRTKCEPYTLKLVVSLDKRNGDLRRVTANRRSQDSQGDG
jgi:TolB-like protein